MKRALPLLLTLTACHNWDDLAGNCTVESGCLAPIGSNGGGSGGPTIPAPPTDVQATLNSDGHSVTVTWTKPTNTGGSALTGFTVESSSGGDATPHTASAMAADSSAPVTGLLAGKTYTFTVKALNAVGPSLASSPSSPVMTPGPPDAPTALNATAADQQATITWTAPVNTGGGAITGYTVTSSPGGLTATTTGLTSATVTGLTNGTPYFFTVVATNAYGDSPPSAQSNMVTPYGLPGAPTGVTAVPNNSAASVSWGPAADNGSPITQYTVTSTPGNFTATTTGTPPATMAVVSGLSNGTPYTFTVTATNMKGTGPGATSSPVTPVATPMPPTAVQATAGNASATVQWAAPADTGGSPIIDYTVTSNPGGITVTTSMPMATVMGLTNGTAYTFTVTARNSSGSSQASAPSNAVTPATTPDPPASVVATPGNASASVQWVAGANGGSPLQSFTVTASPDGNMATVSFPMTSATVPGLTNGKQYTFTVTARNMIGTSLPSAPSNTVTPVANLPDPPTNVTATAGDAQAMVSWSPPGNNGGSAIIDYTVTSTPGGIKMTTGSTGVTMTGLTNGTAYTFTVTARNMSGSSSDSAASSPVTPGTTPGAPTSLNTTRGPGQAMVTWTAPASNGGYVITSYTVTSSPGGFTAQSTGSPPMTSATVMGLANGTSYTFTVTATNFWGTGPASSPSNSVTPATVPQPPTNPMAIARNASADVSWTPPINNGGDPITAYSVTYNPGNITVPVGNVTTATINGLTNNTAYTFTVVATNSVGNSVPSQPSPPVTPIPPPAAPTGVTATMGTSTSKVTVSWSTSATAMTYTIYRAGLMAGMVTAPTTTFDDTMGAAAPAPSAPAGLTATTNQANSVNLTWSAPATPNGMSYAYTVVATNNSGSSSPSAGATGYRQAYAVTDVQVSSDNGVTWASLGASAASYMDLNAPAPIITPGTASATAGTRLGIVSLSLSGASVANGATATYLVRGVSGGGNGATSTAMGNRLPGALNYQWQRTSTNNMTDPYSALPGLIGTAVDDLTAPADSSARWYDCLVSASGAVSQPSIPAQGYVEMPSVNSTPAYGTDGVVNAVAQNGGQTYIGGTFSRVAPLYGAFAVFPNQTSSPQAGAARVDRDVYAIAPDGSGGWYIGGSFHNVSGVARNHVAHIVSGGALDMTFNPNVDGDVYALSFSSAVLYIGGAFANIGGQARSNAGAVDATGAPTAWNPGANGAVRALHVASSTVYAGGDFTMFGAAARNRAGATAVGSSSANTWNPNVNATVRVVTAGSGTNIMIGGDFTMVGATAINALAMVSGTNGGITGFNATISKASGTARVYAYTIGIVGGDFDMLGGSACANVGVVSTTLGQLTTCYGSDGPVYAVGYPGGPSAPVYAAGAFTHLGGGPSNRIGRTQLAWPINKNGPGSVYAIAMQGTVQIDVAIGGSFSSFGGSQRDHMASFDSSGALTAWNPGLDGGTGVYALVPANGQLFVGGDFQDVKGTARTYAAGFYADGGLNGWNPGPDKQVLAMALGTGVMYLGGSFTHIGPTARGRTAMVDLDAGTLKTFNAGLNGDATALAVTPGAVYVGGPFTTTGGNATHNHIAQLQSNGVATAWAPSITGASGPTVNAITVVGNTVYAGGTFDAVNATSRPNLAAIDATSGALLSFAPAPDGPVNALAQVGDTLFIGGGFTSIFGQSASALTGMDVNAQTFSGWAPNPTGTVQAMCLSANSVIAGGTFTSAGTQSADFAIYGP